MTSHNRIARNRGFTIVELMISLAIAMVLILGATSFLATTDRSNRLQSAVSGLNVSGRFGLDRLARDIRMSGYRDSNWTFGPLNNVISATDGLAADESFRSGLAAVFCRYGGGRRDAPLGRCDEVFRHGFDTLRGILSDLAAHATE